MPPACGFGVVRMCLAVSNDSRRSLALCVWSAALQRRSCGNGRPWSTCPSVGPSRLESGDKSPHSKIFAIIQAFRFSTTVNTDGLPGPASCGGGTSDLVEVYGSDRRLAQRPIRLAFAGLRSLA